jgi:uncharacterized protein YyaL (SSP411 family)
MSEQRQANALIGETSPYLQQHAYNPVYWYPWGEQALAKARQENKPILLSIGYSACHWCHVMEHESFEDEETAAVMNRHFINIKVDREERPDLDKIYQNAYQLLNRRGGGWPLNMFLMPDDHTPFFGGTYFPPDPRHGMPAFKDVLLRIAEFYQQHPHELVEQNTSLRNYLEGVANKPTDAEIQLDASLLDEARRQLAHSYDGQYGGFGQAPKFPHPTNLERLLRHWAGTRNSAQEDEQALEMLHTTLHAMASGGIYDQLGGGFCRYSVDAQWLIPHFEKMLYDNGPLLALYADAWAACGDEAFRRIAAETAEWVMREMQSPQGGYYSTLDADSEGEEGKFYVWTPAEVKHHLSEEELRVFTPFYGLDKDANFEGHWHLHVARSLEEIATQLALPIEQAVGLLNSARQKLFNERETRIRPGRDEKILTAWNGLMIKGMAVAGRRLGNDDYIQSAQRALDYVRDTLWVEGRLLATAKDGRAHLMAYLDDYVFLIDGILALLEARWRNQDLELAISLMDVVLQRFSAEQGGFYFTADDHEQLIQRPRPWMDDALPAGNGIAAQVMLRLGYLLGESRYLQAAAQTLRAALADMRQLPHAHNALLTALEEYLYPTETVIVRGAADDIRAWTDHWRGIYAPGRLVLGISDDAHGLLQGLAGYTAPASGVMAYVCRAGQCEAPVSSLEALEKIFVA